MNVSFYSNSILQTSLKKEATIILPQYIHEIDKVFPPSTLRADDRISLGVKVLEKYGEAQFPFYQRVYRLSLEEHQKIFEGAKEYAKDVVIWEALGGSARKKDIEAVLSHYPKAAFSLLTIKKENWRSMPIVEIEGKRYYFYSEADKGPVVDASYIEQYKACKELEKRPDFIVLKQGETTVFLMEFMGDVTPDFRKPSDIKLLVELIKCRSLNKKGLDMLPCRVAIQDDEIYCVDQKLSYCTFSTEFEAFQENIKWLKGRITGNGYPEESELLELVDKEASFKRVPIFEKMLQNVRFGFEIRNLIPLDSLDHDGKVAIAAASLKRLGTRELFYVARDYKLSVEEQKIACTLAGEVIINNTVSWDKPYDTDLYKKAAQILSEKGIEGKFSDYCNYVGNYKGVLTVTINTGTYVVSEKDKKYIECYEAQMKREHRPDFMTFPLGDDKFLFLAKFMGSEVIDYSNAKHLELLADLAMNFSDGQTFDRNAGNLVVSGDKLFYVDKDLTYCPSEDPRVNNIKDIFFSIDENLHLEHERVKSKNVVKKWIEPMLYTENPKDLEILKNFFPTRFTFEEYVLMIDPNNYEDLWTLEKNFAAFFSSPDDFSKRNERVGFAERHLEITDQGFKCFLKIRKLV